MFDLDQEKEKNILRNFRKVIDQQDSHLINKNLYYHLNLNCNFDAYFNLEGFRREYEGEDGFKKFMSFFDKTSSSSQWIDAPEISKKYTIFNHQMADYITSKSEKFSINNETPLH